MGVEALRAAGRLFTYDDLRDTPDDGMRYEISNGTLVVNPSPGFAHQALVHPLLNLLADAAPPGLVVVPDIDVVLRPDMVKRPDVVVTARRDYRGAVTVVPALVVEISSPSTRGIDRGEKRIAYAEAGVEGYWIVDPDARTVTVLLLEDGEYREAVVVGDGDKVTVERPFPVELDGRALFGDDAAPG